MRTLTLTIPLNSPIRTPTASAAETPMAKPYGAMRLAATSEAIPTVEPTERSISDAASAKVMPTAITAIGAAWRPIAAMLFQLRKPWSRRSTENAITISISAAYTMYGR